MIILIILTIEQKSALNVDANDETNKTWLQKTNSVIIYKISILNFTY